MVEEPEVVTVARRVHETKTLEKTSDGVIIDLYSSKFIYTVWDALNEENRQKVFAKGLGNSVDFPKLAMGLMFNKDAPKEGRILN